MNRKDKYYQLEQDHRHLDHSGQMIMWGLVRNGMHPMEAMKLMKSKYRNHFVRTPFNHD